MIVRVGFERPVVYLAGTPKARAVTALDVHAPSVTDADVHALRVTQGDGGARTLEVLDAEA